MFDGGRVDLQLYLLFIRLPAFIRLAKRTSSSTLAPSPTLTDPVATLQLNDDAYDNKSALATPLLSSDTLSIN
jgi:hypothetical protein